MGILFDLFTIIVASMVAGLLAAGFAALVMRAC